VRHVLSLLVDLIIRGYAGVPINPNTTSVSFVPRGGLDGDPKLKLLVNVTRPIIALLTQGEPEAVDEDLAAKILAEEQLEIEVNLGLGGGYEARYYTCDFSYDYVRYMISPKLLKLVSMGAIGREYYRPVFGMTKQNQIHQHAAFSIVNHFLSPFCSLPSL